MKLFIFVFLLFSYSHSSSGWRFIYKQMSGDEVFLDFESIVTLDGLLYWKELVNFSSPISGISSMFVYMMGDCEEMIQKSIKFEYFLKHFGNKLIKTSNSNGKKWVTLDKESDHYRNLKIMCNTRYKFKD